MLMVIGQSTSPGAAIRTSRLPTEVAQLASHLAISHPEHGWSGKGQLLKSPRRFIASGLREVIFVHV